jgi:peptidoglycan/xylan/chitin deacetylase (PgdA/CDA1 family)
MTTLSALCAAPIALANWVGFGRDEKPCARALLFHGTPRREAATLERQLRWLRRRFDIVPLHALARAAAAGEVGRKLALTFDDGLRSNIEIAYPLLRSLGLPATFFVCPGLVDRGAWLWTHESRCRLARLDAAARSELAREYGAPAGIAAFVEWMKHLDLAERRRVEARLAAATPRFEPTAAERADFDLASWEELRALDPEIVTIGSHTLTHPVLPGTPPGELEREVGESREQLERRLGHSVDSFAYPNGDINAAAEACVRRHYTVAMTVERGVIRRGADACRLPRLAAPPGLLRLARRIYA